MLKEEVERPVPNDQMLVPRVARAVPSDFGSPAGQPSKSAQMSYRCTRHALRHSPAHTRGPQKRNHARKSYSHCTSHEWSATSHDVSNAYKGGTVHIERNTNNRKLQVLLFVFVTSM